MLKRHQCVLDLKSNCLSIGTTGTTVQFLSEGQLDASARLAGPAAEAAHREEMVSFLYKNYSGSVIKRYFADFFVNYDSVCLINKHLKIIELQ